MSNFVCVGQTLSQTLSYTLWGSMNTNLADFVEQKGYEIEAFYADCISGASRIAFYSALAIFITKVGENISGNHPNLNRNLKYVSFICKSVCMTTSAILLSNVDNYCANIIPSYLWKKICLN